MTPSLIAMIAPASAHASPAQRGALAALRGALAALRGALAALRDTPHTLCLYELEMASPAMLGDLRAWLNQRRPGGLILLPPLADSAEVTALCLDFGCNIVRLSSGPLDGPVTALCSNHRQAAADATNYLIAIGHQRIAFIAGPDSCRASQECELGYIDALASQGLDRGAELVAASDGTFASGQAAARLLFEVSPRPTAILGASDDLAAGALHAAHEHGIAIPRDLSIVGFGDGPIAALIWPQLTSVRLPESEMAFAAAIELIGSPNAPPQPVEFFGSLVLRASTGPVA